ncbi:MAG: hypothetical protein DSY87_08035 [Methylococcus sp.]|nr:MAG: hypothetical protein DSY87_08035 [Methylococcus sp.]
MASNCAERYSSTSFYVLNPTSATPGSIHLPETVGGVGIGLHQDLKIPGRPGIVTRKSQNTVGISDLHRWANPLKENISRDRLCRQGFCRKRGHGSVQHGSRSAVCRPSRQSLTRDLEYPLDLTLSLTDLPH